MKKSEFTWVLLVWAIGLTACGERGTASVAGAFTHADSLTESYLILQDTVLKSWNVMMKDENEKVHTMHELLHALMGSAHSDKENLVTLEARLDQLERIRFTQRTMSNVHMVEEYDFASNSLISELLSAAESQPEFSENDALKSMVDKIRTADQRVNIYREEYDAVVTEFNEFVEAYKKELLEIDQTTNIQKRPLFAMEDED